MSSYSTGSRLAETLVRRLEGFAIAKNWSVEVGQIYYWRDSVVGNEAVVQTVVRAFVQN